MFAISIRYEDSTGKSYEEIVGQYSVDVKESGTVSNTSTVSASGSDEINPPQPEKPLNITMFLLIASGVIVLIIIVVVVVNIIRKRK